MASRSDFELQTITVIFMVAVLACGAAPGSRNGGVGAFNRGEVEAVRGSLRGSKNQRSVTVSWGCSMTKTKNWEMVHLDRWGWFGSGADFWMAQMHRTVKSNGLGLTGAFH
jgi:hypothetical protein